MDGKVHQRTTVLVVADWAIDPHAVVAACGERRDASFVLVVPAWLHGLDWAGDPQASTPCAERQLDTLTRLCVAAGMDVVATDVGDPDPMCAIGDALASRPAGEVLLFARRHRFMTAGPLDLAHRAQRMSGVPVRRIAVGPRTRQRWMSLHREGYCDAPAAA
jgi:hypothetical protein